MRRRILPAASNDPSIDELYGLEPVIEPGDGPGAGPGAPVLQQSVVCPWCGERFTTLLDLSAGSQAYVEDCQVCCQPIEMSLDVDADGRIGDFDAGR